MVERLAQLILKVIFLTLTEHDDLHQIQAS